MSYERNPKHLVEGIEQAVVCQREQCADNIPICALMRDFFTYHLPARNSTDRAVRLRFAADCTLAIAVSPVLVECGFATTDIRRLFACQLWRSRSSCDPALSSALRERFHYLLPQWTSPG